MGVEFETRSRLPAKDSIRHDGGDIVVVINVFRVDIRLECMRPCEIEVTGETFAAVLGLELQTSHLVRSLVLMADDMSLDEVLRNIIESVKLEG